MLLRRLAAGDQRHDVLYGDHNTNDTSSNSYTKCTTTSE